jgi:hypothetical protein
MRNSHKTHAQRRDHYQELTDKIIASLEAGTTPWRRPWDKTAGAGATAPVNAATGHRYRGINLFVLGMSPLAMSDPRWCSYRQAAERGWQVRKGEKSTPIYFYKPIEIEDRHAEGGAETRRIPMLRTFSVFHASQIDGIPDLVPPVATKTVPERIEDVEIIVKASGVPVRIGGDRAFYSPPLDLIQMGSASISVLWIEVKRQHSCAQEFGTCATIHCAFQGLQPIDLSLRLPIAPFLGQGVLDRVEVASHHSRKALHPVDAGVLRVVKPSSETFEIAALHQAAEPHGQLPHDREVRPSVLQDIDLRRLLFRQRAARLDTQRRGHDRRDAPTGRGINRGRQRRRDRRVCFDLPICGC